MTASVREGDAERETQGGFLLVEALVALFVIALVLLLEMGLQGRSRIVRARLAAEIELVAQAEATIESVRAGIHPLVSGPVDSLLVWPRTSSLSTFVLEVEPTRTEGVCNLVLSGASSDGHDVRLETHVWRQGSPCQ